MKNFQFFSVLLGSHSIASSSSDHEASGIKNVGWRFCWVPLGFDWLWLRPQQKNNFSARWKVEVLRRLLSLSFFWNVLISQAFHFLFQYPQQFIIQHSSVLPNSLRAIFLLLRLPNSWLFLPSVLPLSSTFPGSTSFQHAKSEKNPNNTTSVRLIGRVCFFGFLFVFFFSGPFGSFGTDYRTGVGGLETSKSRLYLHNFLLNILSASVVISLPFRSLHLRISKR